MSNHQRTWDRRTCCTAALSVVLASGVALTVCAAKGDMDSQPAIKSPVATAVPTCGGK